KGKRNQFSQLTQQLDDYSPLKTLDRGFVYTTDDQGKTVSSIKQIKEKELIKLHFKDGDASATVKSIRRNNNGNKEK
ncbi:MAG TPA: exodeoxyribonuclease VII large subunit, partial [Lactobacillus acetotolerans]|nr:exodeoxyribonuclease VII large subunit [Lactobacillus acetotolerans]